MSALVGNIDSANFDIVKLIKKERLKRLNLFNDQNTRWDPIRGVTVSLDESSY